MGVSQALNMVYHAPAKKLVLVVAFRASIADVLRRMSGVIT